MKTIYFVVVLLLNVQHHYFAKPDSAPERVGQYINSNGRVGPPEHSEELDGYQEKNTKSLPKVVIDTDAGIDDAVAIFMVLAAHKRGDLEVVGITTVNGNTGVVNVTNNVLRILDTAQSLQIPVYNGSWTPLERPWSWEQVEIPPSPEPYYGWNGFGDADLPPGPSDDIVQEQPAAEALMEIVRKYEGSVTLIAIGPLTNLAKAQQMDHLFTERLASLYIMGGNTEEIIPPTIPPINLDECGDFNFYVDAEAAGVILENTIYTETKIHLVPSEFCYTGVSISHEYHEELRHLPTEEAHLLNQIEANCTDPPCGPWVTYDQLASAWMLDNILNGESGQLVTQTGEYYATLQLEDLCRGEMVIDYENAMNMPHNLIIMEGVNEDLFKTYLRLGYGELNKLLWH